MSNLSRTVAASLVILTVTGFSSAATIRGGAVRSSEPSIPYRAVAGFGDVPMFFEENAGQVPEPNRFVGRSLNYTVLIAGDAVVFRRPPTESGIVGADVRMEWLGSRDDVAVAGSSPLPGRSNYLVGSDPTAWNTDIATYGAVTCQDVFPGVDVRMYGSGTWLEYDVLLDPGADPDSVRFRIGGARGVRLDEETGALVVETDSGEFRHQSPVVYQPSGAGKRSIDAQYRLMPDGVVEFNLGDHDGSVPLVIDPVVTFTQFAGGAASNDFAGGAFVDAAGSVYVTGQTQSVDLAPLVSPLDGSFNGISDVFVMKIDPSTGAVAYSTYIGGSGIEQPSDIAVDPSGGAYVTGFTTSSDFPTTEGAYDRTLGGTDAFAFKISPTGGVLEYSTFVGGSSGDLGRSIAVDSAGRASIVGNTTSSDLETLPGAFDRTIGGGQDAFVVKLNPTGSGLVQATYLGGTGASDVANAATVASNGDLVVGGSTSSSDFPTTVGAFDRDLEGNNDEGFVVRLTADLSSAVYSSFFGRSLTDRVLDVSVDSFDRATFVGSTNSQDLPVTPGAPQPAYAGGSGTDGFVSRFSASASTLELCTYLGGTDTDVCSRVCLDSSGSAYVAGETRSLVFPTTAGAFDRTRSGSTDGFVTKYLDSGALSYSTLVGGNASDPSAGVGVSATGAAVVVGSTSSYDFPTTTSLTGRPADGAECYITVLAPDAGSTTFSTIVGGVRGTAGSVEDYANSVITSPDGTVTIAGATSALNFPSTPGGFDSNGGFPTDVFLMRLDPTGRILLSSTVFGGRFGEHTTGMARAPNDDVVVVGATTSDDFPTTPGCFDATLNSVSEQDCFVIRLSADGTQLRYGTYIGTIRPDVAQAVAVDATGAAYITGWTEGSSFPTTPGAFDTTGPPDFKDSFVTKLNPTGTGLVYSTFLGGSFSDRGFAISVDGAGQATVVGDTFSTDFPVTGGAFQPSRSGDVDAFVTKLNSSGSAPVFSTYLGGTAVEFPAAVGTDGIGNILIAGSTASMTFPTTSGAFDRTYNGGTVDGFIAALTPNGTGLAYSTFYGGDGADNIASIAVDSAGVVWVCGDSDSANLPLSENAVDTVNDGTQEAVLAAFGASGSILVYGTLVGGSSFDRFYDLAIDDAGAVTAVGQTFSPELVPSGFGISDASDALLVRLVPAADTVGIYVPASAVWFERFSNSSGNANRAFSFGAGGLGLLPIAGDWDGVGGDSPGLYDPVTGAFFLRNSNTPGPADLVFAFGAGGDDLLPLVGDWNGDGIDTVGVYGRSTGAFFLRNANASGNADIVFTFGVGGADVLPLAGDWDADGSDSIGLYQVSTGAFFLRNSASGGAADFVFTFGGGGAGLTPVAGDWDGDGRDTIGLHVLSAGFFFLRNSNSGGVADIAFGFGAGGETPVVGNWAG